MRLTLLCIVCLALAQPPALGLDRADAAIAIHPDNPKYFLFRGKPTFLLTATEHYGSVLNRPFDYAKYLADLESHHLTMTRTFLLFRELASDKNPASPCKPRPEDYISPWPRTGPGKALDGQPQFDVSQWNPEYFDRLHKFLDLASRRGIVVELTLLSNAYGDPVWALNPLRAANNIQHVGNVEWPEYTSLKDASIVEHQLAYVRKIVQETAAYDNVYYEICNEPGGGQPGHVTPTDVDAWQTRIAAAVRDEMQKLGRPHLIFGSQAFSYTPVFTQPLDQTFDGKVFDCVNVHPLPGTVLGGRTYQLGNFMSKELRLQDLRTFGLAAAHQPKPAVYDEDNAASMFRDDIGWTIHRKRAWTALTSGANYDMIDFSLQIGMEAGTPESAAKLRTWFGHLSDFFHTVDFIHAKPKPTWVAAAPDHVLVSTFAVEGKDYVAYLADQRETDEQGAHAAIAGDLQIALPTGRFDVRLYSPTTGKYLSSMEFEGGRTASVTLPPFHDDLVIRATRK